MKPLTIGITGAKSGVGKTALAEMLLGRLPGWGAIKFTKTDIYTSVVEEPEVLLAEGKDTARLLAAGARKVIWVKSPGGEGLSEAMALAMDRLSAMPGVIVEGNGAVEVLAPDIVIFIDAYGNSKNSARRAFDMAHVVLRLEAVGGREAERAGKAVFGDAESCVQHVLGLVDARGRDKNRG